MAIYEINQFSYLFEILTNQEKTLADIESLQHQRRSNVDKIEAVKNEIRISPDVSLLEIIKLPGMRSSDKFERTLVEAAMYATVNKCQHVELEDILQAYVNCVFEPLPANYDEDIKYIRRAFHGLGHALITKELDVMEVRYISILGEDETGEGIIFCDQLPPCLSNSNTTQIMELLGGMAAEEIMIGGCVSEYARADWDKACELLRNQSYGLADQYSELLRAELSAMRDEKVEEEMKQYYKSVKTIIMHNDDFFAKWFPLLMDKKIIAISKKKLNKFEKYKSRNIRFFDA